MIKTAILSFAFLCFVLAGFAQAQDTATRQEPDAAKNEVLAKAYGDGDLTASYDAFPTLHPLVVHFPLVLLLLAAIAQVAAFFVFKRELSWVTLLLLAGGFIGAVVAATLVHLHTQGLAERAQQVLEIHETYATYTLWLSGIAVLIKAISHFYFKRRLMAEIVTVVVVVASATFVSLAGHYGSQLAYVEGIGAQGRFIEQHE
ncbi:hypothetical protein I2I11_02580 [Pontibacter sp. 172403-2]|uniref:DUF2231 domain-containing protein n=1 Tax=Pontibacter rufus TaxID=2791028 RepID=UPI0018AF6675|nr:DUF2231 domain-containing protein [Pontibacter sp. 172403-2]MBF9252170.1 hypothetical protein [Pontibacter sp. 172403-2]